MRLFIDGSVIERISELGIKINFARLSKLGLTLSVTPDLRRELKLKVERSSDESARALVSSILEIADDASFFGFSEQGSGDPGPCLGFDEGIWASDEQLRCIEGIRIKERASGKIPKNRADAYLVAFGENDLVVTNDTSGHWIGHQLAPA